MIKFKKNDKKCTFERMENPNGYFQPQVYISVNALVKMNQYVQQCDKEIGWLCLVDAENLDATSGDRKFTITDTILVEQDVTAVTTDLNEKGLQKVAEDLMNAGRFDDLDKVKAWGHSHVNMDVNPSGTDDDTFEEYYLNAPYFIRIIANKKGALRCDVALTDLELIFYSVDWKVAYTDPTMLEIAEQKKKIEQLYDEAVHQLNEMVDVLDKNYADTIKADIKEKVKSKYAYGSYGKWKSGTANTKAQLNQMGSCYSSYSAYDDYYDDYYGYGYYGSSPSSNNNVSGTDSGTDKVISIDDVDIDVLTSDEMTDIEVFVEHELAYEDMEIISAMTLPDIVKQYGNLFATHKTESCAYLQMCVDEMYATLSI